MKRRIESIETGTAKPQVQVNPQDLLEQHEAWEKELRWYLKKREPATPWSEAERAMETHARAIGLEF